MALFASFAVAARAQTLPQLTVTALSIVSERTSVPEGEAFHLTIHVHAKQRKADFSSLILPDVTNLTILGDEKRYAPASNDGTDYLETLTVAGVAPGEATVSPAYIDARDPARGNGPFRFSSNALRLRITGTPEQSSPPLWKQTLRTAVRTAAVAVIGAAVLVLVGFVLARTARGRKKTYVTLPPARPVGTRPPPPPPQDGADALRRAATRLSSERSREAAAALRSALFEHAGARKEETLAALLERIPADRHRLRAALRSAERATFVDEPHLQGAIDDLLDAASHVISA